MKGSVEFQLGSERFQTSQELFSRLEEQCPTASPTAAPTAAPTRDFLKELAELQDRYDDLQNRYSKELAELQDRYNTLLLECTESPSAHPTANPTADPTANPTKNPSAGLACETLNKKQCKDMVKKGECVVKGPKCVGKPNPSNLGPEGPEEEGSKSCGTFTKKQCKAKNNKRKCTYRRGKCVAVPKSMLT